MKAVVYVGPGLEWLKSNPQGLIITDCPKPRILDCLKLCEKLGLNFLNYYGDLEPGRFPGEKAVEPYARIIKALQPDLVVDPFMGSGTTGLACILNNVDFIGVEILYARAKYAVTRLQNAAAGADTVEFRGVSEKSDEEMPV